MVTTTRRAATLTTKGVGWVCAIADVESSAQKCRKSNPEKEEEVGATGLGNIERLGVLLFGFRVPVFDEMREDRRKQGS